MDADRYNTPIEDLDLSVRAYNCLKRSGLMTVGQVLEKNEDELLALRNFGRKSYDELEEKLISKEFLPAESEVPEDTGVPPSLAEEEEEGGLGSLGAALIEALRDTGEAPDKLLSKAEEEGEV